MVANTTGGGGGALTFSQYMDKNLRVRNCIIADNLGTSSAEGSPEWGAENKKEATAKTKIFNCLFGLTAAAGTDSVSGSAEFVDPAAQDYHITIASPAFNSGVAQDGPILWIWMGTPA